jgi:hypothetical protein
MDGLARVTQKCWPQPVREAPTGTKRRADRTWMNGIYYGDLSIMTFGFCPSVYHQVDMVRRKPGVPCWGLNC